MTVKHLLAVSAGLIVILAPVAIAHEMGEKGQDVSVQGEVVDMVCYMGHQAMGEKHADCAQMCVKGGAPVGLVTSKGDVYLLIENHQDNAPYNTAKGLVAKQAKITGDLYKRGGVQAIMVEKAEKAS